MATIRVVTDVAAPIDVCFDLARSIDLHVVTTGDSGERAVAGVTQGLIGMGEEVTWSAKHFGVRQLLTSRITAFDCPRRFRDSLVRGAFARFDHDHIFEPTPAGTRMIDVFDYAAPLGPLDGSPRRCSWTATCAGCSSSAARASSGSAESDNWQRYVAR